ncbi:hypothetical protein, partial [Klebsiella aerogenes]|uniref:hypothetical protein n=1 Tax=Klebsiella aerogenes TaxID=548 RepID=UPI001953D56E
YKWKLLSVLSIVAAGMISVGHASSANHYAGDDGRPPNRSLRLAQSPLPACVLYSSSRLTPEGLMRCSY